MKSKKTKVFITVKTYPTLSTKYDELVCTAGITDKGNWVRIYPIPFRKLKWKRQYKKYQWIELDLIKNKSDFRHESYKPINQGESIEIKELIKSWEERKRIIFKTEKIHKNIKGLIRETKEKGTSLAIFKPKNIVDFKVETTKREWDSKKVEQIKENSSQLSLFDSDKPYEIFEVVSKLPYKFSYSFIDEANNKSTLMIEDWEIGALYWNCFKQEKDEKKAIQKVKQKYFDEFKMKNLHLFLGTTKKFHNIAPNPFIIIGIFYPPVTYQKSLPI